ncbi:hypothetical protein PPL_04757 [Heterostelium album PN500]|uniref:Pol protein n=1 Tax=Heterostelium pallidum (strain ATCC 26659 / Pp 5 / PN500) TaxID=670386 RepID=D3B8G4_HETP5|nr:hypothetical protein PPL_04757 [Heterostelium album PN500]EFA82332.1 hypothetical protein PPL_04757 [Heterostelium album PN500]|eukprot:XP_020434449.1 hypothetical protein PPL_04757 [Heterostelium album PN500]
MFDRLVNHFKKLNDATVELEYKIPVDEVINSLRGCKYFSIGDVVKGYFQVKMDSESRKLYTAFKTRKGIYWYLLFEEAFRSFQSLVFERSSNLDEGSAQGIGSVIAIQL